MKKVYYSLILLSIILVIISITILSDTKLLSPLLITLSIYLFLGSIIKLCKENDKLKSTIICALDLLFWLP